MEFFILEAVLCAFGLVICGLGQLPLSRQRRVRGSAAYLVGGILLLPLPLYLIVCQQTGVSAVGAPPSRFDPYGPVTAKLVHITAAAAAAASLLMAGVLAAISSEVRRPKAPPPTGPARQGESGQD